MNETITQTKICTTCNKEKELLLFSKDKSTNDGLCYKCKECTKEYKKQYKINNRETIAIGNKKYRENNLNKVKETKRIHYIKHKEYIRKKHKEYYIKNAGDIQNKAKEYRDENKEKIREYAKTESSKNSMRNSRHKRRSITKKGDVTTKQISDLRNNAKICYWCNESLKNKEVHIDHYIPLSKGGEHTISNLVISCFTCNLKKHAKDPIDFANSIGRLF